MTALHTTSTPAVHDSPSAVSRRSGMLRSLHVRNYRLYASGQLISLTGTWMQRVAQDWLVLELTNSGTALGIVTALQFGPSLVLGMWGGILADRLDKRRLLLSTQTALGLVALLLGVLSVTGLVSFWQVLLLALLLGVISAIDTPVRQSFVVEMVGRDDLANAVAINSTIFNTGRIIGPAIAGLMISAVGTGWAFLVNAASSIAVVAALAAMRTAELHPSTPVVRARGQLRAGLRYVTGRADLLLTMSLMFIVGTFGLNFQITTALMAKQVFHTGASGYGWLSTMLAVGACAGAVLATMRTTRASPVFLLVAATAFSLLEIASGLMPTFLSTALVLVPTGLAMLTLNTAANSSVQLGVAPTMRGRVMALYLMCFLGGSPVGAPAVGWLASVAGPRSGLLGGGLVCLLATAALGLTFARRAGLSPADMAHRLRLLPVLSHS